METPNTLIRKIEKPDENTWEYYLIIQGEIKKVDRDEYYKVAGTTGENATDFATKEGIGFIVTNPEKREERLAFYRTWINEMLKNPEKAA